MASTSVQQLQLHSTAVPLLLVVLAAVSALWLRRWASRPSHRTSPWPPAPPALPIVGHLHLLGKLPHQSLSRLSSVYGPLMGLRLGSVPTIVASSPLMAKQILQTHDLNFADRPRSAAAVHMYFDCSNMGFVPYGSTFKLMRQLCASELFSARRLSSFRHVREEEMRELARAVMEIGQQGTVKVELRPGLLAASNNINCRMAMRKKIAEVSMRIEGSEGGKQDLLSLVEELLHLLGVFYVGDFIPWLRWLDPHGYLQRMKAAGRKAKALMQDIIDKRRHERQGRTFVEFPPEDFLDVLLAAAEDPNSVTRISDDNIMGLILDFFAGGSDTSSIVVEWALANLINNQKAMDKLQTELDSVVGKERFVIESDIENLPYLGFVIKETMRLHPPAPLLIPHEAKEDCKFGVYRIPKKTRAYVNAWAIGRDPSIWERPLDFWPERFDGRNLDLHGQNFELLPFGSGRRGCPGWGSGLKVVHIMLATLIQGFTWSISSPNSLDKTSQMQLVDMTEKFGIAATLDKPLSLFARPRLSLNLY